MSKKSQNEKRQATWYQVLFDEVIDHHIRVFWVNNNYMHSDGLTKLSSKGGRVDLVKAVLKHLLRPESLQERCKP